MTQNLIKIEISPLNHNFIMLKEKLLLGKFDSEIDILDVLLFAQRDFNIISMSAFDCYDLLNAVNIILN